MAWRAPSWYPAEPAWCLRILPMPPAVSLTPRPMPTVEASPLRTEPASPPCEPGVLVLPYWYWNPPCESVARPPRLEKVLIWPLLKSSIPPNLSTPSSTSTSRCTRGELLRASVATVARLPAARCIRRIAPAVVPVAPVLPAAATLLAGCSFAAVRSCSANPI